MEVSKIKEYVGKPVTITYSPNSISKTTAITEKNSKLCSSIKGEILAIDGQVIVIAPCLPSLSSSSNDDCAHEKTSTDNREKYIRVLQANEITKITEEQIGIMSIRNYIDYCENLREGLFNKSQKKNVDFYKASYHFRIAMTRGFVNDDIMKTYLQTTKNCVTNINFNKNDSDEKYIKEINQKIEVLNGFRRFTCEMLPEFYQDLSDFSLKEILISLYIFKSYDCSDNILHQIFQRYSKDILLNPQELYELPKVGCELLFFGLQMEAMAQIHQNPLDYRSSYPKAYHQFLDLILKVKNDLKNPCLFNKHQRIEFIRDNAESSVKKIEIFKKDLFEESHFDELENEMISHLYSSSNLETIKRNKIIKENSSKSILFRLIFNDIKKRLEITEASKGKDPDPADIKFRYDRAMALLYHLFNHVKLFFADFEDQKENKWQMALELLNIYHLKLILFRTTGALDRFNEKKEKYKEDIKSDILAKLDAFHAEERIENKYPNYFHCCPRPKLTPISKLFLKFDLFDEYLLIARPIINVFTPGVKNKTPDIHLAFCHFQMANIFRIKAESKDHKATQSEYWRQAEIHYRTGKTLYETNHVRNILKSTNDKDLALEIRKLHDELDIILDSHRPTLRLKKSVQDLYDKCQKDQYNEDKIRHHQECLEDIVREIENNNLIDDTKLNTTLSRLKTILAILDQDFKYTTRIFNSGLSSINQRVVAKARITYKERVDHHKSNVRSTIRSAWGIALGSFIQNRYKNPNTNSYQKEKDVEATTFFATLDQLSEFSKKEIINIIEDTFKNTIPIFNEDRPTPVGRDGENVIKRKKNLYVQFHVPLLIIKAQGLGIASSKEFHTLLADYCINCDETIDTAYYKSYYCMALNPSDDYTLETRIDLCDLALLRCKESIPFKGRIIQNKDYPPIFQLKKQLENEKLNRTKLGELRSQHHPHLVASELHELFSKDHKIKYIWHDLLKEQDDDTSFVWRDSSGKTYFSYAEYLTYARTVLAQLSKDALPEDIFKDITTFLSFDSKDKSGKPLSYGWNNKIWQTWLTNPATASLDPNNSKNNFPGLTEIDFFRSNFRCQSPEALQERLQSVCMTYWESHEDIACKINVEQEVVDKSHAEEDKSPMNVMTWLPRIEKIIRKIFDDIYKLVTNGRSSSLADKKIADKKIKVDIKIKINKETNTIKITHVNSHATKTVEDFIDKLQMNGGAIGEIASSCLNLVDYAVESVWKRGESSDMAEGQALRVPILYRTGKEGEPVLSDNVEGFTHILYLYEDRDYTKEKKKYTRKPIIK